MEIESFPFIIEKKVKSKPDVSKNKDGFKKPPSLSDGEGLKETFMPEDSGAFVSDVEEPEEFFL